MTNTEKLQLKMQRQIDEAHRYQGQLMDEIVALQCEINEWKAVAHYLNTAWNFHYTPDHDDHPIVIAGKHAQAKLKELQAQ